MLRMAVALEIHRVAQVAGRHELRLAHRAGIGAGHCRRRDIAALEDLQRGHEFAAEERARGGPPTRGWQAPRPRDSRRCTAPKLDSSPQMPAITPVLTPKRCCTRLNSARLAAKAGAPVGDALVGDQQRPVARPGHGEFGLVPEALQHLLVQRDPGEGTVQRAGGNAGALRLGPHAGQDSYGRSRRRPRPCAGAAVAWTAHSTAGTDGASKKRRVGMAMSCHADSQRSNRN